MSFSKVFIFALLAVSAITSAKAQGKTNVTDTLGRKQGHWVKYGSDRKKVYEGDFVNDIPTGKFIYYLNTGKPWAITVFSNKGTIGHTQHLNADGKVTGEGKYINQQKDSLWKFYDDSGKLISEESYLKGKKHGISKVYYNNGQLAEQTGWANDLPDGMSTKYFENGQIKSMREYVNGIVEGKSKYNYPDGKIYAEGAYKADVKEGVWSFYNEDGTLKKKLTYIRGKAKNNEDELFITKEEEEQLRKKYENSEMNNPNGMQR